MDLGTVDAEAAACQAFEDGLGYVQFLDEHRRAFEGIITDFANFLSFDCLDGLADKFEIKLKDGAQPDELFGVAQDVVVIDDQALWQDVADVLVEEDELAF